MRNSDVAVIKKIKRSIKDEIERIVTRDMIWDNIKDLIPDSLEINSPYASESIMRLKFKSDTEETPITIDVFEKMVTKLSKKFLRNPHLYISQENLDATWYMRLDNNRSSLCVELVVGNTEKCELIPVKREIEEFELTGYCALLKDKKFYKGKDCN